MKKTIILIINIMLFVAMNQLSAQTIIKEGFIQTNGIKTYYKTIGTGEPLIVVHGGPGLAHNYLLPKFKRLAENYQVIFYDQRACGKTSGDENPDQISVGNLVEDLEALRNAMGIKKMNLIGQSWGGILALNYSIKYPKNLKNLIVLESGPCSSEYEIEKRVMERLTKEEIAKLTEITTSEEFKNHDPKSYINYLLLIFKAYFYDISFHKELDFNYFTTEMIKKNNISEPMFAKYFNDFDIYDKLEIINCPTLIIHGKYDVIPYQAIERVYNCIPESELILFENCGHFAHIEKNEEYFNAIEKFLSENINIHQTQNRKTFKSRNY